MIQKILNLFGYNKRSANNNNLASLLSQHQNSFAGEAVTPDSAMTLNAVNACIRVISEDVASAPIITYQRTERGRRKAREHQLYSILHDVPNDDMTAFSYVESRIATVLMRGNTYSYIKKVGSSVQSIYPLMNQAVEVERKNGVLKYLVKVNDKVIQIPTDQILHVPGLSFDGVTGLSVIEQCANSLGVALAQEKFASKFFKNGALTNGYWQSLAALDADQRLELEKSFAQMYTGADNAWKSPVIGGLEYKSMGVPPEQSQFLQSRQYSVIDICRLFRVSPSKIGDLTKMSYASLEQASIDHVRSTLGPWFKRFEQELNRKLFTEAEKKAGYYCEFEPSALMRGDRASQDASFTAGRNGGWLTINEIREMDNRETWVGGDVPTIPLNSNATTPPEAAPEPTPEPQEKAKSEVKPEPAATAEEAPERFLPFVQDAAERISTKVRNAMEREAATGEKLVLWLDDYLQSKANVFNSTFQPIARALKPELADLITDNFGENLRLILVKNLKDAVQFDAVSTFKDQLNKYTEQAILETNA
jgi:HK97 family phage portal protein